MPLGPTENRIPHTPGALIRKQLLERLRAALRHRLTLVGAPPGYGKTTVVSQFARQTPHPVAWHAVMPRERDLPNLYTRSLSALEAVTPGISAVLPPPGDRPASELAALIAEYLRENLTDEAFYILDDLHHLTGSPATEAWLRALLDRLPRSCHLILITRTIPNLPFAELIASGEVMALGQQDLRLTEEEVEQLAHQLLSRRLSSDEMRNLIARLDGWPAGIMLALQPLPSDFDSMLSASPGPEALFEALARSMLDAQRPDLRHFLLASSTLPRLTPELCSTVLGLSNSAAYLALAQTRNLFLARVPGGLIYHTLFRDFLQQQLRSADPEQYVALHLKAARWFEEQDDIEEAFDQYLAAQRPEQARDLAERAATAYYAQGRFETMLAWSAQLEVAGVLAPILDHECSMIHTDRLDYDAAEAALARARAGYAVRQDALGLAKVEVQQARILLQRGQYPEAVELAGEAAQSDSPDLRGRALRVIGLARLRLGDAAAGVESLEEALRLFRESGFVSSLSHVLQDLQFAYTRLGRLEEAGACLQEVVAIRRELGGAGNLALALNNLGYYYHQRGDYEQANLTFQEALNVIRGISDRKTEGVLLWSLGDLRRDLGFFEEAQRLYDKALELLTRSTEPALHSAVLVSMATLRRWQGRSAEAALIAQEALALAETCGIAFEAALARAAAWAARAWPGEAAQTIDGLEAAAAELDRQGARYELIGVKAQCAGLSLLQGNEAAAEHHLRDASRIAQEVGSTHPLTVELAYNAALEALARNRSGFGHILSDLERLREARPMLEREATEYSAGVYTPTLSLRVLTLGQEVIERDGVPIRLSEWRSAAARELFLYLLFSGPQSRSEIGLIFWPDGSPEQVRANFHTTLHRARQPLGADVIVYQNEQYSLNPEIDIRCDAHELVRWTSQARLLPPRDARAADLWRRAVDLYRGDFLPSLDAEWVIYERERLRGLYLEALAGSGHCARARKDFQAALGWYAKALNIDPYREDIHRAVMRCYQEMGERSQVLIYYNEVRRLLNDELGVEPSEETVALAKALLN